MRNFDRKLILRLQVVFGGAQFFNGQLNVSQQLVSPDIWVFSLQCLVSLQPDELVVMWVLRRCHSSNLSKGHLKVP